MKTNKEQTENHTQQSPEVGCCDLLCALESMGNVAIWQGSWAKHIEGKGGKPIVTIYDMDDDCEEVGDELTTGETLKEAIQNYLHNVKHTGGE